MTIQFYNVPSKFIAGMTLKNPNEKEHFNMALHSCQNEQDVLINRNLLSDAIGLPLNHFVFANQTHSANFKKVTNAEAGKGTLSVNDAFADTDAFYSFEKNIVLTTMTADCVPVTFYSEKNGLIGTIHSGWSGTVKEISLKLFNHLKNNEGINLENIYVHIGYSICADKFEVDIDVAEKFKQLGYADQYIRYNAETNKYHIDNQLVVKTQCELAGVPTNNITIDRKCTYLLEEGFSYREDRNCGRHVSFIVRKED